MRNVFKTCMIAAMFAFSLSGCGDRNADMLQYLDQKNVSYYFSHTDGFRAMDSLNRDPQARETLIQIALDTTSHSGASFIACEILLSDTIAIFYTEEHKMMLADLYRRALIGGQFRNCNENIWAIPCITMDSAGTGNPLIANAGKHLIEFESGNITGLYGMLDDTTRLYITGAGDQTTSIANERRYRVKDISALFICQIRGWEFNGCLDPTERDAEIRSLKEKVTK